MSLRAVTPTLVWAAALVAGACSRPAGGGAASSRHAAADPWLASASARHQRADVLLDRGDAAAARAELRAVLESPAVSAASGDHRRVLQDTRYRLARLDLDGHDARAALAEADHGLALGRPADLFVANLLVVRGAAHEALGDRAAAADDYHQALVINDELLQQEVGRP